MLLTLSNLRGSKVIANDGEAGVVKDVLFDDHLWTIRFIVVDTASWLSLSEKVLISPISLQNFDAQENELRVSLSKELIKDCPKVEEFEPVSRKFEKRFFDYYGYGYYWDGPEIWGEHAYPMALSQRQHLAYDSILPSDQKNGSQEPNLRSAQEFHHYSLKALDEQKGHVKELIWDSESWSLRLVVVDTRDWLPGGVKAMLLPKQLGDISWEDKSVECKLTRDEIKSCPEFDGDLNSAEVLKLLQPL